MNGRAPVSTQHTGPSEGTDEVGGWAPRFEGRIRTSFENKAHDFPQRVIYRRCGAQLCARIEGVIGGKPQGEEWRYSRAAR